MMLTSEEIRLILSLTQRKTVAEFGPNNCYRVTEPEHGYSSDRKIGALQAKLSILLEMAARREAP